MCQIKEVDNLNPGGPEKRPASISPCKWGSHDVAGPPKRDATCHTGGEQEDSPPESDFPSDALLGE